MPSFLFSNIDVYFLNKKKDFLIAITEYIISNLYYLYYKNNFL